MLYRFVRFWILLGLILQLYFPSVALAEPVQTILSQSQRQELVQIQHHLETLNDLQQRGIIVPDVVRLQQNYYLSQASLVAGQPMTRAQLAIAASNSSSSIPGFWQRTQQFLTFINIALFTASCLLIVALVWLCKLYLVQILRLIPPVIYELATYAVCLGVIAGGRFFSSNLGEWIALPGCLGYVGALYYTHYRHRITLNQFYESRGINPYSLSSLQLCLLWAVVAIIYHSSVIGFLAVVALESFLGFTVVVLPLTYYLGFQNRQTTLRATVASFILLVFYLTVRISQIALPYFSVFAPGLVFMGAFVYYIGLLILSSKWQGFPYLWQYWALQVLTICSGVAALFIGSIWRLSTLLGIGGTFFFLYLLEKYFELPWGRKNWAWATLGLALILYVTSLIAKQYPQYFLFA